jgi:hypothetical protein
MLTEMASEGSTELIEVFDRIIGANIDDLNARQLFSALVGFKSVQKATVRPKIMSLLIKRLSDCVE